MQLKLENIGKSFGAKEVLKGIDFTFDQGKIYGLLGRNGAGKTTLFNCLSSEIDADSGETYLVREGERSDLLPEDIGYAFATPILPEFLTGYEFLKFYMDINRAKIKQDRTIDDYFDLIQINADDRYR